MIKRLSIVSDTRLPTENVGNHGLGRVAWDVANIFAQAPYNYEVTLYAGYGSVPPPNVNLIQRNDETNMALIIPNNVPCIDFSHFHYFSLAEPNAPVLNYISDGEVNYSPPNACVCVKGDLLKHPNAEIVPLGIDVSTFPLYTGTRSSNLLFMAKIIPEKGVELALELKKFTSQQILFMGKRFYDVDLGNDYIGEKRGRQAKIILAASAALLQFSRFGEGGGRISLEAAACGTPTFCLDDNACQEHVFNGVSGVICKDVVDVAYQLEKLSWFSPAIMRQWVEDSHNIHGMVYRFEQLLKQL